MTESETMAEISTKELQALCMKALIKAGYRELDAAITTDHYLENELSGKSSHGMVRVVEAAKALEKWPAPTQDPDIEHDSGALVRLNAQGQIGTVAGMFAVKEAVARAKSHGIALIGIRNYIASNGSMAYYLRRIANEGLIAVMGCNSVAQVAPPDGRERMIGTNPIGIAIPGDKEPHLIADLATSAYAYGKIMVHKDKNEPIPDGILIDESGHPSNDPNDAYNGAILPLAGYKGFSLGLMIELLAGPLIGAKSLKKDLYDNDGLFIIAIDPKAMGNTLIYEEISRSLNTIKDSPPAPDKASVNLPGQRSAALLKQNLEKGTIDVADKTLQKIKDLAA